MPVLRTLQLRKQSRHYTLNTSISPNIPSMAGVIMNSFSISPALPAGLVFDTSTGEISGTPSTLLVASSYIITGTSPTGSTTIVLNITVKDVVPSNLSTFLTRRYSLLAIPFRCHLPIRVAYLPLTRFHRPIFPPTSIDFGKWVIWSVQK